MVSYFNVEKYLEKEYYITSDYFKRFK